MNRNHLFVCALTALSALLAGHGSLAAQDAPVAPVPGPAIQPINSAAAVSTEQFGAINSVRSLPGGRLLVNDGTRRRLLLMDSTLKTISVVLDSLTEVSNSYGTRAGTLIPFSGDSTLFVDLAAYAVLVIDPQGRVVRTRSIWRTDAVSALANPAATTGLPWVDGRGRLVYRVPAQAAAPVIQPSGAIPYIPSPPDSAFIVAVDIQTRMVDTLTYVRIPKVEYSLIQGTDGSIRINVIQNPLPTVDDWAVLADGRVAVLRGLDYRIDFYNTDGSQTSSGRIPFDWRRLSDEDKGRLVDSVRVAQSRTAETNYALAMIRWVNNYRQQYPPSFTVPAGFVLTPGLPEGWRLPAGMQFPFNYIYGCPAGVQPTMTAGPGGAVMPPAGGPPPGGPQNIQLPAGAAPPLPGGGGTVIIRGEGGAAPGGAVAFGGAMPAPPGGAAAPLPGVPPGGGVPSCIPQPTTIINPRVPAPPAPPRIMVVEPQALPDFRPPFTTASTARGDEDGNLWVRSLLPSAPPGGFVYDIINPAGELIARYQLPTGYTILGFGKGKVVYLSMRDPAGLHVVKVQLR